MQTLKITFQLVTPVIVGDHPLHFDGLLAWSKVQRALADDERDPFSFQTDLPLERTGRVWKASQVYFEPGPAIRESVIKKHEIQSMAVHKDTIWSGSVDKPSNGSGKYKAFLFYRDAKWSPSAVAWCVGDKNEVEDLLADIKYLGKCSRIGFGEIASISVQVVSDKESEYWRLRTFPADQKNEALPGIEYAGLISNIQAPYWDRATMVGSVTPIEHPVLF